MTFTHSFDKKGKSKLTDPCPGSKIPFTLFAYDFLRKV